MEQDKQKEEEEREQQESSQESMNNTKREGYPHWFIQARNAVYYVLGIIEVLLAFRLVFKLLGASSASSFVVFIYSFTRILNAPFTGIFRTLASRGAEAQFVFEPATVIAMIVYALVARGIVNLIKIRITGEAYR